MKIEHDQGNAHEGDKRKAEAGCWALPSTRHYKEKGKRH